MGSVYGVLGGGRQGTAAAYDFAHLGEADKVMIGDIDLDAATKSAARGNELIGRDIAEAHQVDGKDHAAVKAFLEQVDAFLSAVPYWLNPGITRAAIEAKACMTDLGGKTDLVLEQMKLTGEARKAGIAVIPDCGQVPGMGTGLTVYCMSQLDETDEIMMWDGGNALHPKPPFNYILTFNIAGLTNEYYGYANFIRNGRLEKVKTFQDEDYETVEFPAPIGLGNVQLGLRLHRPGKPYSHITPFDRLLLFGFFIFRALFGGYKHVRSNLATVQLNHYGLTHIIGFLNLPLTVLASEQFLFQICLSLTATGFGHPIHRTLTEPEPIMLPEPLAGLSKGILDTEIRQSAIDRLCATVEKNPGYWRNYRKEHPEYAERNRLLQKVRRSRQSGGVAKMDGSA